MDLQEFVFDTANKLNSIIKKSFNIEDENVNEENKKGETCNERTRISISENFTSF